MPDEKKKSCRDCPNYLSQSSDTIRYFKKNIGAPMCAKYGYVLGRPSSEPGGKQAVNEKLNQYKASNCPSYGHARSAVPEQYDLTVMLPHPEVMNLELPTDDTTKKVLTCGACQHYIRDEIVAGEIGWSAGLCAAKGKLLLTPRLQVEARNCEFRRPGINRGSTEGMFFLPEYEDALKAKDPTQEYFQQGGYTEPTEYETDRDVSPEDTAKGIRAWRKIADPEDDTDTRFVWLPIYENTHFSTEEQAKIPHTGDDEHPELYIDHMGLVYKLAVLWTELDETPALWGIAGTGKTELYRHAAWLMQLPFERISITGSTELEDLAGKMMYEKERGTYFQEGRLVKAWGKPCVICLDEPNTGMPDVWQFLRPLTDNSKQLVLDMANGENRQRNDDCYLGLAMNPAWDPRNVGTGTIGDADGSRLMHIETDLPPEHVEREILRKRCEIDGYQLTDNILKQIMGIAKEIRALSEDGTLPVTWGIRHQIKVARLTRWLDMLSAYRMAAADYLEPEAREALLGCVRAQVPSSGSGYSGGPF